MAANLPQLGVEHVGRDDLLETAFPVLAAHQIDEFVVNVGTCGKEETATGRELVEEEEFVLHTELAMVTLGRLFL